MDHQKFITIEGYHEFAKNIGIQDHPTTDLKKSLTARKGEVIFQL